jgi:hypothetical protein
MIVEMTSPQSRWKPPLAETFAMSAALLVIGCFLVVFYDGWEGAFIVFGWGCGDR